MNSYVKPDTAILEQISTTAGATVQDLENAPSLTQAWSSLRPIIREIDDKPGDQLPPIVSYNLSYDNSIITRNALRYAPLKNDFDWNGLRWWDEFIPECLLYFREWDTSSWSSSWSSSLTELASLSKRIGYIPPPLPQQTAKDRAIAQLRLLKAMAQGIGVKEVFKKEE